MSSKTPKVSTFALRRTASSRTVTAGCFQCNGSMAIWTSGNAMGVAARHHDATGHETWVDQIIMTRYGSKD
ncbi:hypothetical protein [Bosea sp. RAC05]|uniref:hypothetical protein n=1 Tax=Bosea sp. RAC05 TaxID=1842539 RepID=UPI00083D9E74|nr:hypothetical protein [Bosea sp. RAC05]AOG03405.1 hypothetical protein BSY19_5071 [Bosea sp. RAC05]